MSGGKLRIVAGPPIEAALAATGNEFPTGRLNAIAARYLAMIEDLRPALSRAEWLAICDANNGYGLIEEIQASDGSGGGLSWQIIWANVADTPEIGDKWQIDQADLVARLRAMTTAQKIAVAETIQRFWTLAHLSDSVALDLATSHPATWPEGDLK